MAQDRKVHGEVVLRAWQRSDADALVPLGDDHDIWLNLRERFPRPFSKPAAELWLADCVAQPRPVTHFAVASRGQLAGGVRLTRREDAHKMCADLTFWVGRPYWGHGIGSASVQAATRYGFDTLGLERVQAFVFDWNPVAPHVLETSGFALEGRLRHYVMKDGRLGDALLYARLRGDAVSDKADGRGVRIEP